MQSKEDIDILIVDFLDRKISADGLRVLNNWVSGAEENSEYFEQVKRTWMLSSAAGGAAADTRPAYYAFVKRTKKKKFLAGRPNNWRNYAAYAAAVLMLLMVVPVAVNMLQRDEVRYTELNIPRAAKLNVVLPDGSVAWINADSKLVYPSDFGKKERRISLEGEGYFEVVKDRAPFIVAMDSAQIRVLGTKFNVRNYKEDPHMRVALFEGSVAFSNSEREVVMKPGQTLQMDKAGKSFNILNTQVGYSNLWINNKLFFDEMSLGDIAFELSRAFNVNFHFDSDEVKKLVFYGDVVIEHDNLKEILDVMSSTNKFKYTYRIEHNEVYISSSM